MLKPRYLSAIVLVVSLCNIHPALLRAEDAIEKAGVATGVTAGNMWLVPLKAISVTMGVMTGALSFIVTGGNAELTRQIWRDVTEDPYLITPELAKKAVGERPELSASNLPVADNRTESIGATPTHSSTD